jgi:hypothetical protein
MISSSVGTAGELEAADAEHQLPVKRHSYASFVLIRPLLRWFAALPLRPLRQRRDMLFAAGGEEL